MEFPISSEQLELLNKRGKMNLPEDLEFLDLNIKEGDLLNSLSNFFEFDWKYLNILYKCCNPDFGPPSFGVGISKGNGGTRKGRFSFQYFKKINQEKYEKKRLFYNNGKKDLKKIIKAFNNPKDYEEGIKLIWRGWIGYKDDLGKHWFSGDAIELTFNEKSLTLTNGNDIFEKNFQNFGPLYGNYSPFYQFRNKTLLKDIFRDYKELRKCVDDANRNFITCPHLNMMGYTKKDLVFGILQIAGELFPPKEELNLEEFKFWI